VGERQEGPFHRSFNRRLRVELSSLDFELTGWFVDCIRAVSPARETVPFPALLPSPLQGVVRELIETMRL